MRAKKLARASLVGAAGLLVATGTGVVGASTDKDLDGNNRVLFGSDIFKVLTNDLLSQFSTAPDNWGHDNFITAGDPTRIPRNPGVGLNAAGNSSDGTYYTGGGQGVGDSALVANTQQISVGTASIRNTIYGKNSVTGNAVGSVGWIDADGVAATGNPGPGGAGRELSVQGTTETLLIGLDGLSILGHSTEAGTANGLAVAGKVLTVRHYVPIDAQALTRTATDGVATVSTTTTTTTATTVTNTTTFRSTWTFAGAAFTAANVGNKLIIAGAAAANNATYTITQVVGPTQVVTFQRAPVDETFAAGVTATIYASKIFVVDPNTDPTTAYGATIDGATHTARYVFNHSLDVIRLLYGGLHHGTLATVNSPDEFGTFDAGSDVRRSLVDSWGTLFSGSVPHPAAALNRVWRRSELSGAAAAFVALVNFGARTIGAAAPAAANRTNPFANTGDANGLNSLTGAPATATVVDSTLPNTPTAGVTTVNQRLVGQFQVDSRVLSNAGPGDFGDFDPIRHVAQVGPNPTNPAASVDLEQVAQNDGTLGVLLPVFPPDALDGAAPTQDPAYASRFCSPGRFDLLSPGFTPSAANPAPQGGPFSGLIYLPYFLAPAGTVPRKQYNCIATSTQPHAFGAPTPADNRVFNLAVKSNTDGHYYQDAGGRFLGRLGYYRIHTTLSSALASATTVATARQLAGDAQTANLIVTDPLSLSFTGRGADTNAAFSGAVSALSLSGQASLGAPGQFNPSLPSYPTSQEVKNLVIPGASPVYPLARRIYVATLVGLTENPPWSREGITRATGTDPGPGTYTFNPAASAYVPRSFSLVGGVVTPGPTSVALGANTAVRGLQGQEAKFARAFQDSDRVGALFEYWGFVPLPSAAEGYTVDSQGHPANGITALDYPEDAAVNALPLNGTNETGNPYAGRPVTVPAAYTSNNNQDATVVSPADALVPYGTGVHGPASPGFAFPYAPANEPASFPWP